MDELKEYYTPLVAEMLGLIEGHRHFVRTQMKEDGKDPVAEKRLGLLAQAEQEVLDCARARKAIADSERKDSEEFMKNRLISVCEDCDEPRHVEIVGEKKNEVLDVMCDLVKCKVCGHVFVNYLPNNPSDMKKVFEYIEKQCSKLFREDKARMRKASDMDFFVNLENRAKIFKVKLLLKEQRDKELRMDKEMSDKAAVLMRDFILKNDSWDVNWDILEELFNDDDNGDAEDYNNN